ncbi:MAG: galactokinase [Anaerolineales bacterium]|nr:galactokinase [Anaerolineales bacterium]
MDVVSPYKEVFKSKPRLVVRGPGRVNLLGEHVDYNGGPVLPAAIEQSVWIAADDSGSEQINIRALDLNEAVSFCLDDMGAKQDKKGHALPVWALYPAGVAWILKKNDLKIKGINAVFSSNIPMGSGLSSSAAIEVAFAVLWQTLGGWSCDRLKLAQLCQQAENQYVGVACGIMDQFATACGVKDHALYFDTRSLEWYPAPLPKGTVLVIADSGMRRSLTSSAYNDRRAACEEAVRLLQKYKPEMTCLRDISPQEFVAYGEYLPPLIRKRAEHVVKEIARVESAVNALEREDTRAIGALMFAGHVSLRDYYEVSIPELDCLVSLARSLPGCIGARLTGAGFGGCTINLVWAAQADEFIAGLEQGYREKTGRQAKVYVCHASEGTTILPVE